MIVASLLKKLCPATLTLCFVLVLVVGAAAPVRSAPATTLRLDPAAAQVMGDEIFTLALWMDDVENLYRVELHLDYDWAGLEVQDADPSRASVQIEPGSIFCATCALWNEALNGRINFVAQRDPSDGPFSGSGVVAYITLLVTATEPDTYTVSFDQAATRVLDNEDNSIAVDQFTDAALILLPPLVTLTGWTTREGWGNDDRSVINAVLYPVAPPYEPVSWGRACTDAIGDFTLRVENNPHRPPAGVLPPDSPPSPTTCVSQWAFMRFDFTNYLSECYWECADGDVRDVGWHDLEGGDVNEDGCINILDIVCIIGDFGEIVDAPCYISCTECPVDSAPPNAAPPCDINGDCRVNVLDLTQAAGNFGLCSNCP